MKCCLCDCESAYRVWNYEFCKDHYKDLASHLIIRPSLHIVKYFVATNGTMKPNKYNDFCKKYVIKHEVGLNLNEYHVWIDKCPRCGESMERKQFKNDIVKEHCVHCEYHDEYQLL